ncbi:MAG: 50S ribosomal protein L1 [archaeon YNP-LCB-003-016]|jgi:large subunit ribosomal protein L1|uniref:50S ribosomal protein L1 n=1 Tax=Candidatus Culexarchaeum yellowstonense TaxID=2928963 RepID=UPI0026EA13AE|nr:50S ribosomal protein L1 [Candidatus Culexarchaeum yellowstonense]MCC6017785.1 50S ribosomal protein L1 [Candidatus Verstraetearchaeota archaeon]MCR6668613.1 50S ribosomal protein L1 [Candidatus Culexarchaeum yellowstonense]MCR6690832.1 50S ribosomal protein L1 [Candidatus Culexarchaeum yellowstonense]
MSSLEDKLRDAIEEAKKESKKRNFKQSVELIINLRDVDLKKPENRINEKVILPNQIGKEISVCVFGDGDFASKAKEAGAKAVISREALEKLASNKKELKKLAENYDVFIARADYMPLIGRHLGPILGPRNKMPEPIPPTGDIASAISKAQNTIWIRTRNQPLIQCIIGTEDMPTEKLLENALTVISKIREKFKSLRNIESIYIKTTMGKPVKITV